MLTNYHTHTARCQHAVGEDKEYVEAAIKAGLKILGFSDHCPWPFENGYVSRIRMVPSEMEGYFSSIESLRKEYADDITIYIGFEAEYAPVLNEAQEKLFEGYPLDYLILGQHFIGTESESVYVGNPTKEESVLKDYVDLIIEGISTGKYLYLAHPDVIHYTGSDEIYEKHMSRLCRFLKEKDVPIEMNVLGISGLKHYPAARFWRIAGKIGNTAVIGIDAHMPQQFLNHKAIEEAEMLCEKYGLKRLELQL